METITREEYIKKYELYRSSQLKEKKEEEVQEEKKSKDLIIRPTLAQKIISQLQLRNGHSVWFPSKNSEQTLVDIIGLIDYEDSKEALFEFFKKEKLVSNFKFTMVSENFLQKKADMKMGSIIDFLTFCQYTELYRSLPTTLLNSYGDENKLGDSKIGFESNSHVNNEYLFKK